MRLAFLSALSGQSIFLLGPPGVAKSLIARRLKFAFRNAKSFEYLMHRFSTPDEVFGPISISKLKNEDKLERITDHYLPGANIAFLDEIWKAGPSIQNTLLTILNEKIFRNGEQEIKVDLYGIVSASNELPEEGQGLDALWDRFLLRLHLRSIGSRENFEEMILETKDLYNDPVEDGLKISRDEYYRWQTGRDRVNIPKEILDLIHHLRVKIENHNKQQSEQEKPPKNLYVSDRRWKRIITLLRTSAFLNGRSFVDLMDCFLLPHVMWDEPSQITIVDNMVRESIRHQGYTIICNIGGIKTETEKLAKEIEGETRSTKMTKRSRLKKYRSKFYKIDRRNRDCFIKIDDFNKLRKDKYAYVDVYSKDVETASTHEEYLAKEGDDALKNSDDEIDKLEKEEVEEKLILTRRPHDLLIQTWDSRIVQLEDEIKSELNKIDDYISQDLKYIKLNLFVNPDRSHIIFEKLDEMKRSLHQLKLNLDEQREIYHNVREGELIKGMDTSDATLKP